MNTLKVTLIDVGWGDSIFIEAETEGAPRPRYGLIDSNDQENICSSFIFLKRYFERSQVQLPEDKPVFDFVILTHFHADHGDGLKKIMREYGTKAFWYPKTIAPGGLSELIRFANRSDNVGFHEAVNSDKDFPAFGPATGRFLWPPYSQGEENIDAVNENNNSVVLALTLDQVTFLLTGDAEGEVWQKIGALPADTRFFKVPHHGSVNGTFLEPAHTTPWVDNCPGGALLGISSHIRPFHHPHKEVVDLFQRLDRTVFRTDEHYHVTVETNGRDVKVKYSHFAEE